MKSLLPPQTHSQSQTQPRVLQECRQTRIQHKHTATANGPIHTTHTHIPTRLRGCRRQELHTRKHTHTQIHLLSLCITNTNELIDVQQRQRSRQLFPQSEARQERKSTVVSENVCVPVSGVLFYFLSASQHLGFQRLKLSDGAKLAKLWVLPGPL